MGRLPEIVCFGAQKAGTSWLFSNLAANPGVWEPPLKEMHFFNHAPGNSEWMISGHRRRLERRRAAYLTKGKKTDVEHVDLLLRGQMMTEEWYRAAYAPCPQHLQTMDITPAYALLDDDGYEHMARILGSQFKAIFLIRDPVSRAVSAIKGSFSGDTRMASSHDEWMRRFFFPPVAKRNNYSDAIQKLDRKVGERVLYLPFGRIKTDPLGLLQDVEEHCNLPTGSYVNADRPRHVSPSVVVPDGVADAFRRELKEQYHFLKLRFGEKFCAMTN